MGIESLMKKRKLDIKLRKESLILHSEKKSCKEYMAYHVTELNGKFTHPASKHVSSTVLLLSN